MCRVNPSELDRPSCTIRVGPSELYHPDSVICHVTLIILLRVPHDMLYLRVYLRYYHDRGHQHVAHAPAHTVDPLGVTAMLQCTAASAMAAAGALCSLESSSRAREG